LKKLFCDNFSASVSKLSSIKAKIKATESLIEAVRNIIRTRKSLAASVYLLRRDCERKSFKKSLNASLNENIFLKEIQIKSQTTFSVKLL
jgi:hypothetical protein